jgi:4-diphosphocytidyl-2-C-methyl-D-erythritol kinase
MIVEKAFAKVNLFLNVCGKRDDGFHDIESVMQSVSLCDEIRLHGEISDKTQIELCNMGAQLPTDRSNLVVRAVEAYLAEANINAYIKVELEKNIPIAAGLAGGSSDAAATLRAINRLFGACDADKLLDIAAKVGSDVPFCLVGGTAICRGRGERIQSIKTVDSFAVIAIGDDRVSTPEAYAGLDRIYSNFDGSVDTCANKHFDMLIRSINNGTIPKKLYNIFETEIPINAKSVNKIKAELDLCGADVSLMSGSGPSVFGLFSDEKMANNAARHLENAGYAAYSVKFCQ